MKNRLRQFDSLSAENRHQRSIAHHACDDFNRSPSKGNIKKLCQLFASCGERLIIESGFRCDYGDRIFIGHQVFINFDCIFLDGGQITIQDHCLIGPKVQILTVAHPTSAAQRLNKMSYCADVSIASNVWIGAGSIIMPGVTIGENSVIGAGSLVTKDVAANSLYYGSPAKFIRELTD